MIEAIRGKVVRSDADFVVLDANGVMYRADIPASTHKALPPINQEATVLMRLRFNMNEGIFDLFGFATETERECFDILTSMSGIGPRKGLMILSQIDIAAFANAVIAGDLNYISKIKGIGKKTAERLVVELREKLAPYTKGKPSASAAAGGVDLPEGNNISDAVQALMVLGCRPLVAEKAIAESIKELGEDAPTEQLVRAGLKHR